MNKKGINILILAFFPGLYCTANTPLSSEKSKYLVELETAIQKEGSLAKDWYLLQSEKNIAAIPSIEYAKQQKIFENKDKLSLSLFQSTAFGILGHTKHFVVTPGEFPQLFSFIVETKSKKGISLPLIIIADSYLFNAFAIGTRENGCILLSRKIFEDFSDDTLEAIIEHELTHLQHNHFKQRLFALGLGLAFFTIITGLAVRVAHNKISQAGSDKDIDRLLYIIATFNIPTAFFLVLMWLDAVHSRACEREADAGTTPQKGVSFIKEYFQYFRKDSSRLNNLLTEKYKDLNTPVIKEILKKMEKDLNQKIQDFEEKTNFFSLSSHPSPKERLAQFEKRVAQEFTN